MRNLIKTLSRRKLRQDKISAPVSHTLSTSAESSELERLQKIWEENFHLGGSKFQVVNVPSELFKNNSPLWDSPELVMQCKQFFTKL
jgi:hypothetical protein